MGSIISDLPQAIPCTDADLFGYESQALELLPSVMRTPSSCSAASLPNTSVSLSGIQTMDSVSGFDGESVLLWQQTSSLQNGIWTQQTGAWLRQSQPAMAFRQTILVPQQTANQSQWGYYWIISRNPIKAGFTPVTIERLGDSLFNWHLQLAEDEIATDLDRGQKPIRIQWLRDPRQLRKAKIFKTLEILYRQAAANSADGMPDRHERLHKEYASKYSHEMMTTSLQTLDAARIKGRSVKVVRS